MLFVKGIGAIIGGLKLLLLRLLKDYTFDLQASAIRTKTFAEISRKYTTINSNKLF